MNTRNLPPSFLHVEDDDGDAELFGHLLEKEWPGCRIVRIWTRAEFQAALELENFDLILCDHTMGAFDGLAALEIARASCPETPFIFLSGTIGEERAIEALKRGASDYVIKSSPARFITAVTGALVNTERESARRRAEEALQKNREQFRQIAESIDDFVVLLDARGFALYTNPAFARLLPRGQAETGFSIFELVHPDDRGVFRQQFDQAISGRGRVELEYRHILPNGATRYMEARASIPRSKRDDGITLLLAGRDVTERKQAQDILLEQASLLGKARDAIYLIDMHGRITQWNASAERIYGHAAGQVLGRDVRGLLFKSQISQFETAFALTLAHGEWQGEFRFFQADGRQLVIDSTWSLVNDAEGHPKSMLCIDSDVTARKLLELELQRSQRIEGLGMLAGGIAHDLNNILSPILMSVGLLRPLASSPEDKMILDTLETSASHGSDLVQQILTFARGGGGQRTKLQMGPFLQELQGFLRSAIRRTIELRIDHDPNVWPILADATQLKQVVMNLCVNARDAMPDGGSIQITAENVDVVVGFEPHGFHGKIPVGPYVRLSVADTGTGMPPELVEKIFDPFFTTKGPGKGTGLGLSTLAGIIRNHEGAIQVESAPGKGTTFRIYLPASASLVLAPSEPAEVPSGRGEAILVIDDDEATRYVAEKLLISQGYEVHLASNGVQGLETFEKERDRISVVICDQMMSEVNGIAVLEKINAQAPSVKLILMSGFIDEFSESHIGAQSFMTLLPKPLKARNLFRVIREAIAPPVGKSLN